MPGPYTDQLLTTLVAQDGTVVAKVGGAMGGGINVKAPLTATANGSTGNVDIEVSATPTLGNVTATSLTLGSSPKAQLLAPASVATTDKSTVPLGAAITVPVSKSVKLRATIGASIQTAANSIWYDTGGIVKLARLASGNAALEWSSNFTDESNVPLYPWASGAGLDVTTVTGAADNGSGLTRIAVVSSAGYAAGQTITIAGATTTGGLVLNRQWVINSVPDGTHLDLQDSTFVGAWSSGGTVTPNGMVGFTLVASVFQFTVTGITAAPWAQSKTVHFGDVRASPSGSYFCSQAGTTSGAGTGPTGTGTAIVDGTAKWDYLSTGTAVPITWAVFIEQYTY